MSDTYRPRPIDSHTAQGEDAQAQGHPEKRNPNPKGSVAAASWLLGYRIGHFEEGKVLCSDGGMAGDEDEAQEELLHRRVDMGYARMELAGLLIGAERDLPDAQTVAQTIGIPLEGWPLNCFAIATSLAESGLLDPLVAVHGSYAPRYGVYTGPVSTDSPFARKPIIRHGWVEFENGLVVDPTRFVFHGSEPSLWAGVIDEYDLGANRLRRDLTPRPLPAYDAAQPQVRLVVNNPETLALIGSLLKDEVRIEQERVISRGQAHWLANLPPEGIGEHAPEIYRALISAGCTALIPYDNRLHVLPDTAEPSLSEPSKPSKAKKRTKVPAP